MRAPRRGEWWCAAAALIVPVSAAAHGFGRLYNLPVPFWLYAWGAASALVLSFIMAGIFATAAEAGPAPQDLRPAQRLAGWLPRLLPVLRGVSVFLLLLCIATGLWGNRDPLRNFSMTYFWVVCLLGGTYLTALLGNFYVALNPWRAMADAIGRVRLGYAQGRVAYPQQLGDWPALALYLGLIWFELFAHSTPRSLAWLLMTYSAINFAGVWWVGSAAWFRHCELFCVFLRLVGVLAPVAWEPAASAGERVALRLRMPFSGAMHGRPGHISTVTFALAMLATTAFDGLRATQWWVGLFWRDPTGMVTAVAGTRPILAYPLLRNWYVGWETGWLLAAPFLYLGAYLGSLALARTLTRSARPLRELALDFGYTLLPIALVYHMTHYATLVLTQGTKILSLVSDPFGRGWNLFGTDMLFRSPYLPGMGAVWHSQVGLILAGHMVSVYLAHRVALRVFSSRRQALVSQLPMLALMLWFTVAGLWILAQPLTAELMR